MSIFIDAIIALILLAAMAACFLISLYFLDEFAETKKAIYLIPPIVLALAFAAFMGWVSAQ